MDALLRRRMMIAVGGGSPTPPVETIPYIRGGGDGSYIDTGITPDQTTKVIVWVRNWNPSIATNWLFGSRIANQNSAFALLARNEGGTGAVRACYGNENFNVVDQWPIFSHYHKYELSADGFYVDDSLVCSVTAANFSNNYNIFLYALNNASSANILSTPADIVACKIYKGGNLVRDYTPAESPSIGLYDAVSDTVFTNAGAGSFTYGTFNPNAYTPLEYISCSGSQYFDSGVKGTASLPIVTKFRIVGTDNDNPTLFGVMTSGTASSYFLMQFGTQSSKNSRANFYINSTTAIRPYDNSSSPLTGRDITFVKTGTSITFYENNVIVGSQKTFSVGASWETPDTFSVATVKLGGSMSRTLSLYGRMYYFGIGSIKNFVPAKIGNKVGMYDTYNDVLIESVTSTPFTAGPTL